MKMNQTTTVTDAGSHCGIHPLYSRFECVHDFKSFQTWCLSHPNLPAAAVVIYVIAIYTGSVWMKNRPAYSLKTPLLLWNLALALFSIAGTLRTGTELYHVLKSTGFYGSICLPATDNVTALWRFAFVMSKFFELIDTFFIVARKRPLMFLHWYHHVTVLLFSWDTHIRDGSSSRYFVFINFFVHSVMYTYYAMQAAGIKTLASISMMITSIQIIQMVLGMLVLLKVNSLISTGNTCSDSAFTILTGLLMYFSYFLLFAHFFVNRYFFGSRRSVKQETPDKKRA